jgi:toxin YoeB
MIKTFSDTAWEDYLYWQNNDKKIIKRINLLIKDISRESYKGLGDPEPLKYNWSGYYSRRITLEHRIVA